MPCLLDGFPGADVAWLPNGQVVTITALSSADADDSFISNAAAGTPGMLAVGERRRGLSAAGLVGAAVASRMRD